MIWLAMTIIALIALTWIALPVVRADRKPLVRAEGELAVYRDQLDEIKDDIERGLTTEDQAAVDEVEISRRMLRISGEEKGKEMAGLSRNARIVTIAILALITLPGTLALYSQTGAPKLPGQPFVAVASETADHAASDMNSAIGRLAARLQENPEDADGWVLLAKSYEFAQDLGNAAEAWGRAYEIKKEDDSIAGSYAEAMIRAAGGIVPPGARALFEELRQKNPGEPRSHFYVGIAEAQAGRGQAAIDIWLALLANSPADAPWLPAITQQINETARQFSIKAGEIKTLPPARSVPAARVPAVPGPSAEDIAAAGQMTEDDQAKMIRSMVERLANRLEQDPGDIEGWLRLARAQVVLNDPEGATSSLQQALKAATSNTSRASILATGSELGLSIED